MRCFHVYWRCSFSIYLKKMWVCQQCNSPICTDLALLAHPEKNCESLTKLNVWGLVKHCQSISCIECSLDPLGSIRAAEVLWHQCDRINTSKAVSGPTAASHSQYSTFHVLLRFTTISHKPTASQTEKDNGPTCCYQAFPQLQWNMSNSVCLMKDCSSTGSSQESDIWLCHMVGMQRII